MIHKITRIPCSQTSEYQKKKTNKTISSARIEQPSSGIAMIEELRNEIAMIELPTKQNERNYYQIQIRMERIEFGNEE